MQIHIYFIKYQNYNEVITTGGSLNNLLMLFSKTYELKIEELELTSYLKAKLIYLSRSCCLPFLRKYLFMKFFKLWVLALFGEMKSGELFLGCLVSINL